ncbi:MAG: LysR substrate-binding domain-containing protein [Pseudomonadota bacterium]
MRPTLRQMQYLVAIADTGRFSEAAKRLHVSQPSLSAQIADMEAGLECVLLERSRSGAFLTPIGKEVVRRARLILSEVEDMKAVTRETVLGLAGRLRLGVLPSVGPYLLPSATKKLHNQFPELRLLVSEERTVDLETHLADGAFDLIISTPEDHSAHASEPLFDENFWICAAPDHELSTSKEAVRLSSLRGEPLLSLGPGHRLSQHIAELARKAGGHVGEEYQGTSLDATRQMAVMGAGVAILPSLYVKLEAQRDKDLTVRPIKDPSAQRTISLIWRQGSPLRDKFNAIAEVLRITANDLLA